MEEITPDQNGLPPKKESYTSDDKNTIVAKAAGVGTRVVAEAYGMDWHRIAAWKKYNARDVEFRGKRKKTPFVIIQSPDGKEITVADVKRKIVESVDKIYIQPDQGKAYWVRGKETREIEL